MLVFLKHFSSFLNYLFPSGSSVFLAFSCGALGLPSKSGDPICPFIFKVGLGMVQLVQLEL